MNWQSVQGEDPVLSLIIKCKKEIGRPDWQEISHLGVDMKLYLLNWDSSELVAGKLFRRWESTDGNCIQLVVRKSHITEILKESHSSATGGHFGSNKTLAKVRHNFYWSTYKEDVDKWCKRCHTCFAKQGPHRRTRDQLQVYNVGSPFERIAVDILGPLPKSEDGNRFILALTDYFTRWPEAVPLPNHQTRTIVDALVTHIFPRFGMPLEIHSDQGRSFESEIFQEVMRLLGI